ncbi:thioredoxin domain-containing protein, partial [bacterium]|nr:thioredoxin domain-containing protein [bacterium]
ILVPMYNETLSVLSILMHLNLFTLPYTLFSIYYQIFKLKKLCWLCLCVQGVLWLEFAITFSFLERNINPLTYTSLQPLVFGFLLPTFVWILIKQPLILASQTSKWRYESLRFRNNPLVFGALLQQAPKVDIGRLPVEIEIGVPHAPHCLTIVVNPKCKPCSHAHREFEELLEDFPEHIRGNFRFLYWKENDEDKRVVQHIIALALSGQQNLSYEALSKWFSYSETKDIEIWKNLFSLNNEVTVSVVEEIIECHLQWAKNVGVSGTPSFFLNGYPLPEGFKLRDLRAYLLVSNN